MESPWYQSWFNTSYYHLLYKHRDEQEANEFIDKLLAYLQPQAQCVMLDLACGRGRHARHLSEKGYQVTGVDLSESSIAYARKEQVAHLEFFVQDMRAPCRINYFDYVFSFFTSFGYFRRMRENEKVLESVNKSLRMGGIYVLDYLNPVPALKQIEAASMHEESGIKFTTRKYRDDRFIYKEIRITDPQLKEPLFFEEAVGIFYQHDLSAMLENAGFVIEKIFGDYKLSEFQESESPRLILVAKKVKHI